jgi:putative phosphoesterase
LRIAVLSDIHGNFPALDAALRDAAQRDVEGVVHLGDLVGYGPRPDEVVDRVRVEGISGVVGNYDLAVCHADAEGGRTRYLKPSLSAVGNRTYLWTRGRLRAETLTFLENLPAQIRIREGPTEFLLTHGSPERANEYLLPETPEERLRELFEATGVQVMVVGHTHVPQAREVGDRLLLNPGSVGKPTDGDPRASYLILDTERGLTAEHVRLEFDVETVAVESVDFGLPCEQSEALRLGRGV